MSRFPEVSLSLPNVMLKVLNMDGGCIWVTIGRTDPLKRLKQAYAGWAGKRLGELDFFYEGTYIFDLQTADNFELNDGDVIVVNESLEASRYQT